MKTKASKSPSTEAAKRVSVGSKELFALCKTWEGEGKELLIQASSAPTWEGDATLRNAGVPRIKCAKDLRELISANVELTHGGREASDCKLKP